MIDRAGEKGTALISALFLVAVMAAVAITLLDDMRFAILRANNMQDRDQAYWYAAGARDFAEAQLARAIAEPRLAFRPDAAWLTGRQRFPIENGELVGEIRDGNNCFNLNGLVDADARGRLTVDADQLDRFEALLLAIGVPVSDALSLAAQTVDWIDSDDRPGAGGAEDSSYALSDPAYRAPNGLIVEREELLALAAMTPALFAALEPHVCVRPLAEPVPLNLNTLRLDQAAQLSALFDGRLAVSQAESLLLSRPSSGFSSAQEFWMLDAVRALEPDPSLTEQVGVETRYFEIEIDVLYAGARFELQETVAARPGAAPQRLTQRYGSF